MLVKRLELGSFLYLFVLTSNFKWSGYCLCKHGKVLYDPLETGEKMNSLTKREGVRESAVLNKSKHGCSTV